MSSRRVTLRCSILVDSLTGDRQVRTNTELIGYLAATFTTLSFVPQALKTIRTRDTNAISSGMYASFSVGVALWFVYGVTLGSWPIILANGITFLLAATILALKIQHG